jgi:murE/murF fusion protein
VLAVTGTNGKTSTAWWLAQGLSNVNVPCGVIGTLGVGQPPNVEHTGLTTPDPVLLQRQFRRFLDQGLKACAIEASSIGIVERRMDGMAVRVAGFTNFTQDHLDYHGSMEAYWEAKAELFRWPGLQSAVINIDDAKGEQLAADCWPAPRRLDLFLRARRAPAGLGHRLFGRGPALRDCRRRRAARAADAADRPVQRFQFAGRRWDDARRGQYRSLRRWRLAPTCLPVPGRMERLNEPGKPLVAVDYAHTPDALDKGLQALRPLARSAAASCGACSAAAATATRPSVR